MKIPTFISLFMPMDLAVSSVVEAMNALVKLNDTPKLLLASLTYAAQTIDEIEAKVHFPIIIVPNYGGAWCLVGERYTVWSPGA